MLPFNFSTSRREGEGGGVSLVVAQAADYGRGRGGGVMNMCRVDEGGGGAAARAHLGFEIVLRRRVTAATSWGCSTKECSTALQWQITASSSLTSSSLFFRFALSSFTLSCHTRHAAARARRCCSAQAEAAALHLVLQLLLRAQTLHALQFRRQLVHPACRVSQRGQHGHVHVQLHLMRTAAAEGLQVLKAAAAGAGERMPLAFSCSSATCWAE